MAQMRRGSVPVCGRQRHGTCAKDSSAGPPDITHYLGVVASLPKPVTHPYYWNSTSWPADNLPTTTPCVTDGQRKCRLVMHFSPTEPSELCCCTTSHPLRCYAHGCASSSRRTQIGSLEQKPVLHQQHLQEPHGCGQQQRQQERWRALSTLAQTMQVTSSIATRCPSCRPGCVDLLLSTCCYPQQGAGPGQAGGGLFIQLLHGCFSATHQCCSAG